jgi:hypothetical protein
MESVLRVMKRATGESEEALKELLRKELEELEKEVEAMKELIKERGEVEKKREACEASIT